jgi:hypothetical protein
MISLSILYNTNLLPFTICALTSSVDQEQQGSSAEEELHEVDTFCSCKKEEKQEEGYLRGCYQRGDHESR